MKNNILMGTLLTEMGIMNQLGKLLCTHSIDYLMGFTLYIIICISLLLLLFSKFRVLADQHISPFAIITTFSFQSGPVHRK